MTRYKSIKDLEKIDAVLASKFKQKDDAVRWCMAIEGPIAEWVKSKKRGEGGKSLYELVCFASERKGILEENLPRNIKAELLTKFCPDAFCSPENMMSYNPAKEAKALQTSMEHCKYIFHIKNFNLLPDSNLVRTYISEIEALIDGQSLPPAEEPQLPTIEERVEAFLRKDVVEQKNGNIYQRIDVQKDFGGGIVPGLSVSVFHSKQFVDEDKPSHIEAYEFVHEKLSTEKLYAYAGKYESKRNIKLYVVSPIAYDKVVIRLAEEKYIGLVLVNMNGEMTQGSYIVQRSIEDYIQRQLDMEVLTGQRPLNTALMIFDGMSGSLTTSLADSLASDGVAVAQDVIIRAPRLTNIYIERQADNLTKSQVSALQEILNTILNNPSPTILGRSKISILSVLKLEISPSIVANDLGIQYVYSKLASDEQLGYIDVGEGTIFLKPLDKNYARDRFTFAHELGHFLLHLPCFKQYCYSTIGETSATIGENATLPKGELMWFEHHANHFAACLLMPRVLVQQLYILLHGEYVQKKYGDKLAPLYYNPKQEETDDSYRNVVVRMAKILNVSPHAMNLRLRKMGLLIMPPES